MVAEDGPRIKVHYVGYGAVYDEWKHKNETPGITSRYRHVKGGAKEYGIAEFRSLNSVLGPELAFPCSEFNW